MSYCGRLTTGKALLERGSGNAVGLSSLSLARKNTIIVFANSVVKCDIMGTHFEYVVLLKQGFKRWMGELGGWPKSTVPRPA